MYVCVFFGSNIYYYHAYMYIMYIVTIDTHTWINEWIYITRRWRDAITCVPTEHCKNLMHVCRMHTVDLHHNEWGFLMISQWLKACYHSTLGLRQHLQHHRPFGLGLDSVSLTPCGLVLAWWWVVPQVFSLATSEVLKVIHGSRILQEPKLL